MVSSMAHRGQRSEESIEFKIARQFCLVQSKFESNKNIGKIYFNINVGLRVISPLSRVQIHRPE
jgi:hypothetical protein